MSAFSDAVLALSPLLYWQLDETSGTAAADSSGNGLHGFYNGTPTLAQPPLVADDLYSVAMDGSTGEFIARQSLTQFEGATAFAVSLVVDLSVASANTQIGNIWELYANTLNYVHAEWNGFQDRLTFRFYQSGNSVASKVAALDPNVPHLLTFSFESGVVSIEIDNTEITEWDSYPASFPSALAVTGATSAWQFFVGYGRTDPLACTVDHCALFTTGLTHTDVTGMWQAMQAVLPEPDYLNARSYLRVNTAGPISARAYLKVNTARVQARSLLKVNIREAVASRSFLRVDTATDFSVAQRRGVNWQIRLYIGGADVTHLATGAFRTDWSKGKSFVASFDLMPANGVLDPADFDGKTVSIEYRDLNAFGLLNFTKIVYSGTVSRVSWMPAQGILRCSATTNSDARFRFMELDEIAREIGGEWSRYVFSPSARGWDHARDRLETRQADMWFMPGGGVMFKPWASASADVEWTDADVLPDSLRHEPALRSGITNRIEVRMDYRYQRLRQRMLRASWSTGVTWCHRLQYPFPLCQRSMIEQAAKGNGGWQLVGGVDFEPIPGPGAYPCFPFAVGDAKYILWGGDADALWAWSAKWTVARRWAQEITERYSVELVAQASVDANGLLEQVDEYGVQSEKDNGDWLREQGYKSAGSGFTSAGDGASNGSGTVLGDQVKNADADGPGNRADFEQAQRAAFAAGAAEIVGQHRHTVTAASVFDPRIKPGITLRVNTVKLRATGHLVARREVFDMNTGRATTEADIGPFVVDGVGIASPSVLDPVTAPALPEEVGIPSRIDFPTHIGGLTTSPFLDEEWTGYLTNYQHDPTDVEPFAANPVDIGERAYPNQFTVEYPEIAQQHLTAIETTAARRIDVDIPNDELVRIQ